MCQNRLGQGQVAFSPPEGKGGKSPPVTDAPLKVFMRRYGAKHSMHKSTQSKMTCAWTKSTVQE